MTNLKKNFGHSPRRLNMGICLFDHIKIQHTNLSRISHSSISYFRTQFRNKKNIYH